MTINNQSLHDRLGRTLKDLRISVTDRCNFRCTYCMPEATYGAQYEFLPREQLLTYEEISRLAHIFVELGVEKVRITGGEPLVRKGIHQLVGMLKKIEQIRDLTLTTNGFLLKQQSETLKLAGLDRVTVSLDALNPSLFGIINGKGYHPQHVLDGIQAASNAGLSPLKINMVIHRGVNDHEVINMARYFRGTGHILRFIEYMDVGNLNGWNPDQVLPSSDLVQIINETFPIEPMEPNYSGEVAGRYRYLDDKGEVGFISSVTLPFCGDCTRVRLSASGTVYTCLFASNGTDLRTPMRDGATDLELINLIVGLWEVRTDRYSELRSSIGHIGRKKVEMYQIGG